MNAINPYIDHMFRSLPATAEARRAKNELRQMSEDRYNELRAQGFSEHEAVGHVITQFGDLDEVADELGIRALVDDTDAHAVAFSDAEATRYIETRRRSSLMIAGGVSLILVALAAQFLVNPAILQEQTTSGLGGLNAAGLGIFFLAAAVAVGMFIFAGVSLSRFDLGDDQAIRLRAETTARYKQERADFTTRYAMGLATGVIIIILSVAVMMIMTSLLDSGGTEATEVSRPGLIFMFVGLAIGVPILIVTAMTRSTLDRLTASGDYKPELSGARSLIERIAGPYWMLVIAAFFIWSFGWDAWGQSWIIWPIAGVLFGFIATVVESIQSGERKRQDQQY